MFAEQSKFASKSVISLCKRVEDLQRKINPENDEEGT